MSDQAIVLIMFTVSFVGLLWIIYERWNDTNIVVNKADMVIGLIGSIITMYFIFTQ